MSDKYCTNIKLTALLFNWLTSKQYYGVKLSCIKRMIKLILSLTVYAILDTNAKRLHCHVCLNSVCYSPSDRIITDQQLSGQLAVDRTANILYYHYQNHSNDFTIAFDLTKANSTILTRSFTFAHAVNQATGELYSSGEKGIYRYNPLENSTELFALKDRTIWHMQFTDKLYYNEFQTKGLYTYESKKSKGIQELTDYQIDDFIIDKRGDIYFRSNSSLYVLRSGIKMAELFQDEIYFLTTDKNGDGYFIQPYTRGIYKINYRSRRLREVGAFSRGLPGQVVFDGDNHIVFYESTNRILYYLSPILSRCTITTKGVGKNRRKLISIAKSSGRDMSKFSRHSRFNINTNKTSFNKYLLL